MSRKFTLVSPEGKPVTGINVAAFAREHGLCRNLLIRVLNGDRQVHKGWQPVERPLGFRHKPHVHAH